jgi:shikimate kinase
MNIILIGYRGTGKSVVTEILSKSLGMKAMGMDREIVQRAGLAVPRIVEKYGWEAFRDMETAVAMDFARFDNVIIDTGGGIIERPENMAALKENGLVFWLKASVGVIVERISSGTERPALTRGKTFVEEVSEVLESRLPKYAEAAQYEIDTDNLSPDEVATKIRGIWEKTE